MTGPDNEDRPDNDVERELLAALDADDRPRFFQVIATAPLYLPVPGAGPDGGQRFITWDVAGSTYLLVFTSVRALAEVVGTAASRYTVTGYDELRQRWPSPQWRLAVNPGRRADAWIEIEAVAQAAAGTRVVPTVADVLDRHSARRAEEAESARAMDEYLRALLTAEVVVPTAEPLTDDEREGSDFPWRYAPGYAGPTIEVFTSIETFAAHCPPGTPWGPAGFQTVLAAWPDDAALALDPGSPLGFTLPVDRVAGLLFWAGENPRPAE
jgi:hypothetical protein